METFNKVREAGYDNNRTKYEGFIPLILFFLFLAVSIPGNSWGVPDIWNPDELVGRVDLALGGELQFDETEPNYNYPSLPKYVMYGIGTIVYGLGYWRSEFIVAARVISAVLGGLSTILVYLLTRRMGGSVLAATLAGTLMIASDVRSFNARFAHNDMYLELFLLLSIYLLIHYQITRNRLWLYGSFYSVGLAASSKYTGGSMVVLPILVFLILNWSHLRKEILAAGETMFIGGILTFLGFASGTPKALLWAAFYFKRAFPAAARFAVYGYQPDSVIGLVGQWGVFKSAVGGFIYFLFLLSFAGFAAQILITWLRRIRQERSTESYEKADHRQAVWILLLALVIFDLPFTFSVNYVARFFIPFVPIFSVLSGLFIEQVALIARERGYARIIPFVVLILIAGIAYSMLRIISTALLFMNDARIPASDYLNTLRPRTVIEYTLYPPNFPEGHFEKVRNYPIYFLKYPGDTVPTDKPYEYNSGEAGLLEREVDYLVIDSLTYARLADDYLCRSIPVECDFFAQLQAGKTSYRLLKSFEYSLPSYLPQISLSAVNPVIQVYERR